jgi:ATP-dependent protease ClpP protease subunit
MYVINPSSNYRKQLKRVRTALKHKHKHLRLNDINTNIPSVNVITNTVKSNDSDDDSEPEEQINPLSLLQSQDTKIYRSGNHIYFRTDITIESVSKLCKLIDEANNEFQLLQSSIKNAMLTPRPLYLHITSYGGLIFAGLMGADAIENSLIPIYTIVEGAVMSSGTLMSIVGKKRFMTKNAYMLVHQLTNTANGTFAQLSDNQLNNEELMKRLKKLYDEKTGGKLKGKRLDNILNHDIYMSFDLCAEHGLVDELYEVEQLEICEN